MIGIWSASAPMFMLTLVAATTVFFALPIMITPLRWARIMLWHVPAETSLTVYFGRCLGAFVLVVEALIARAALTGAGMPLVFEAMLMLWVLMIVIHAVGWLEKSQPVTETLEIGFWLLLVVATLLFWPLSGTAGIDL